MTDPRTTDTWWTNLRWRIAIWLLWRALRIAPVGSAATNLKTHLFDWSAMCRVAWHKRYPHPEAAANE